ncbi:hypothetical protein D3C81_2157340 [compost metagenome]
MLLFLTQIGTLIAGISNALLQGFDAFRKLVMQHFQIFGIEVFTLTFAELSKHPFSFLLLAKALLEFVKTSTQWLNLFHQVALIIAVTQ